MCEEEKESEKTEPMFDDKQLRPLHQDMVKQMGVSSWMYGFTCTQCGEPLSPDALRGICMRLNAKDIGNLSIEVHCRNCNAGYELVAKKACGSVMDFINILSSNEKPALLEFVPSYEISSAENNLLEKYCSYLSLAQAEQPE